ncbi:MAG: HPr family phosphocarrier protein, partial [Candidatus Omnitrophica bacterium]|nr:HPr family phosphocarrier protein [Candidatus Omnitrophota bacterium]
LQLETPLGDFSYLLAHRGIYRQGATVKDFKAFNNLPLALETAGKQDKASSSLKKEDIVLKYVKVEIECCLRMSADNSALFAILKHEDGSLKFECKPGTVKRIWLENEDEVRRELDLENSAVDIVAMSEDEVLVIYHHCDVIRKTEVARIKTEKSESIISGNEALIRGTVFEDLLSVDGFIRLDAPINPIEFVKAFSSKKDLIQYDRLLSSQIIELVNFFLKIGTNPGKELVLQDSVKTIFREYGIDIPAKISLREFAKLIKEIKDKKNKIQFKLYDKKLSGKFVDLFKFGIGPNAITKEVIVRNPLGIHAKNVIQIVNLMKEIADTKVLFRKGYRVVDVTLRSELIRLGIGFGEKIKIIADGKNAKQAIKALTQLLETEDSIEEENISEESVVISKREASAIMVGENGVRPRNAKRKWEKTRLSLEIGDVSSPVEGKGYFSSKSERNSLGVTTGMPLKVLSESRWWSPEIIKLTLASSAASKKRLSEESSLITERGLRGLTIIAWVFIASISFSEVSLSITLWNFGREMMSISSSNIWAETAKMNFSSLSSAMIFLQEGLLSNPEIRTLVSMMIFNMLLSAVVFNFLFNFFFGNRKFLKSFINIFKNFIPTFAQSFLFEFMHKSKLLFHRQLFYEFLYLRYIQIQRYLSRHLDHPLIQEEYIMEEAQSQDGSPYLVLENQSSSPMDGKLSAISFSQRLILPWRNQSLTEKDGSLPAAKSRLSVNLPVRDNLSTTFSPINSQDALSNPLIQKELGRKSSSPAELAHSSLLIVYRKLSAKNQEPRAKSYCVSSPAGESSSAVLNQKPTTQSLPANLFRAIPLSNYLPKIFKQASAVRTLKGRLNDFFKKWRFSVTNISEAVNSAYAAIKASAGLSPRSSYFVPISKGTRLSSSGVVRLYMNLINSRNASGLRWLRTSFKINRGMRIIWPEFLSFNISIRDSQDDFFRRPKAKRYWFVSSTSSKLLLPQFLSNLTHLFDSLFLSHTCKWRTTLSHQLANFSQMLRRFFNRFLSKFSHKILPPHINNTTFSAISQRIHQFNSFLAQKNFPATAKEIDLPWVAFKVKVGLDEGGKLSASLPQDTQPLTPQERDNVEAGLLYGLRENLTEDKGKFLDWLGGTREKEMVLAIHGRKWPVSDVDIRQNMMYLSWRAARGPPLQNQRYGEDLGLSLRIKFYHELRHLIHPQESEATNQQYTIDNLKSNPQI